MLLHYIKALKYQYESMLDETPFVETNIKNVTTFKIFFYYVWLHIL